MGQTIICEIVDEWEETGVMPKDVSLELLQECREIMLDLGTQCNRRLRMNIVDAYDKVMEQFDDDFDRCVEDGSRSYHGDKLTCPHCGYAETDAEEEGDGGEWECSSCGRVYGYKVHTSVTFSSWRNDDGQNI